MFGCHEPAELPEDGWASDPDRGGPGAARGCRGLAGRPARGVRSRPRWAWCGRCTATGFGRPCAARHGAPTISQPVCVQSRPHEFREKSPSLHRADSGASGVTPNDRPAARWQSSSGIAASGTLLQKATAGECIATPAIMACSRSLTPARHEPPSGSSPRVRRPHRSDGPARRCPRTCPHSPARASGPSPHPARPRCRPRPAPS